MEKKGDNLDFISLENYKQQIDIWYRAYNISRERIELFHDFLISLYDLIDQTYLGPELFDIEENQRTHFTWCWDKTIENFSKEKIHFKDRGNHYEYLWNFFLEAYYYNQLDGNTIRISEYFTILFDFNYRKTRSELDMLTEIYKIFEQNLKK